MKSGMNNLVKSYIHDVGMINALGETTEGIWNTITSGKLPELSKRSDLIPNETIRVAQVSSPLPTIPDSLKQFDCRNNALVLAALKQIEEKVQDVIKRYGASKVGIVVGTSTSGVATTENAILNQHHNGKLPDYFNLSQHENYGMSQFISEYTGVTGPSYCISTACSSSAKAFASARALLKIGLCDAVIVGGSDSLCKLTLNGFRSLGALSDTMCLPMSKNRKGITIGEGAALFLLTRDMGDIQIQGVGESSDTCHISSPDPSGVGAEKAIRWALEEADLKPDDIDYINIHGTGTLLNDQMESKLIEKIFGNQTPCSSTKPLTGHTLGAAGAIEVGICWLMLSNSRENLHLVPHYWDHEPDDEMSSIKLVEAGDSIPSKVNISLLSNSFAFGGSNCAVIIGR
jgi:3-oxoacyl-[acyl-carrier-protein] synthase I